jgi:hypothetical protein
MNEERGPLFSDINALHAYIKSVDRRIEEEIANRPAGLRLPHKGFRFRVSRETVVDLATYLRTREADVFLPIEIKKHTLLRGQIIRLDYEPDPSGSTHCCLVPETYEKLEWSLVDPKFRDDHDYSHFNFSISYLQLAAEFEWLED